MPNNHETLASLFDDIAEAIREKDGTSEAIVADTFPERIAAIDTDPSGDATATAADILYPKTAYVNGQKITGSIVSVTPAFDGGDVTGSVTGITGSNVTLSDTNNGISITGAASATRGAVLYNGAVAGLVSKADNDTALAAGSATALTGKTMYITAVTVPKDVAFGVTATADTALDDTSNISVASAAFRKVVVTNTSTSRTTVQSTAGGYTIVNKSPSADVTVNSNGDYAFTFRSAYGSDTYTVGSSSGLSELSVNAGETHGGSLSGSKTIVDSGAWKTTTVTPSGSQKGPYYGRVIVNAGKWSLKSVGWIADSTAVTFNYPGIVVLSTEMGHPGGILRLNNSTGEIVCSLYEGDYQGNYLSADNGLMIGWYVFEAGTTLYYYKRGYSGQNAAVFRIEC